MIASDQGYLNSPIDRVNMTMWPGERYDILIDFSQFPMGSQIIMTKTTKAPHLVSSNDTDTTHIMKVLVNQPRSRAMNAIIPEVLNDIRPPRVGSAVSYPKARPITLTRHMEGDVIMTMVNDMHWEAPIDILPVEGTYEIWDIINFSLGPHPILMH